MSTAGVQVYTSRLLGIQSCHALGGRALPRREAAGTNLHESPPSYQHRKPNASNRRFPLSAFYTSSARICNISPVFMLAPDYRPPHRPGGGIGVNQNNDLVVACVLVVLGKQWCSSQSCCGVFLLQASRRSRFFFRPWENRNIKETWQPGGERCTTSKRGKYP